MNTIKEVLDKLEKEQRRQLMYAFEHGLAQVAELDSSDLFIGVNADHVQHLEIIQQTGAWCLGRKKL